MDAVKLVQNEKLEPAKQKLVSIIEAYRQLPHKEGVVRAQNTLGLVYAKEGDYENTVKCLVDALTLARTLQSSAELVGKLCQQLAAAYGQLNRLAEGIKIAEEALELAQARHDNASEATIRLSLGSMQSPMRDAANGHYQVAVKHFSTAIKLYESLQDIDNQIRTLG